MFFSRPGTLILSESQLRGLRISLNKPVVVTEELAGGPARAAIAAYTEENQLRVTVAVRSLKATEPVFYDYSEEIVGDQELNMAADAAIAFCEGMGFVIGEDNLEDRGLESSKVSLQLWREVTGEVLSKSSKRTAPKKEAPKPEVLQEVALEEEVEADEEEGEVELEEGMVLLEDLPEIEKGEEDEEELVLEEVASAPEGEVSNDRTQVLDPEDVKPAPESHAKVESPKEEVAKTAPQKVQTEKPRKVAADVSRPKPPPPPSLSRFRGRAQAVENSPEEEADSDSRAIGRLKLVKRRGSGKEKPSWLCRVLRAY